MIQTTSQHTRLPGTLHRKVGCGGLAEFRRLAFCLLARFSEIISERPLTPSLSPSDGTRVVEGRVRDARLSIRKSFLRITLACVFLSSTSFAGVAITEFMASNTSTVTTTNGLYEDWIEIHNNSGAAVDLAGWYLTDDITNLRKWRFPSTAATSPLPNNGYLIVFADGSAEAVISGELHASFKLSAGGEFLALVEPDGETVVDQFNPEFPPQTANISYGIDPATGLLAYFATPTPGAANGQAIADAVQFSVTSRTFTTNFDLTLAVASPATTTIRYTLDGSIPTSTNALYASPISISATTRVRARAFKSGLVDGPVRSETFLLLAADAAAFASELPLVVIDNFGAGEIPHPTNATRQVSQLMIFEPVNGVCHLTNSSSVTSRAGIRRRGETSLRSTGSKPNLSVETWGEADEQGQSIEPLGMPADSDWILHAPWTIDTAMIRNPFIYEISNEAGRYAVRTRYVEVFLNYGGGSITRSGDYYGLYILMEKVKQGPDRVEVAELPDTVNSEPDIAGGYIWKKDKDDPGIQTFTTFDNGRTNTLTSVYPSEMPAAQLIWLSNHVNTITAAISNRNYSGLIDVASFADHHILNMFANNADGLVYSTFYHKDRDGLVQMGPIWDFDRSMSCDGDLRASVPTVWGLSNNPTAFFQNGGTLWFKALAFNDPEFWITWVDRWQLMRQGPLSDASLSERIERHRLEITNAAIRNYTKWTGPLNATNWSGKVDVMKNHVLTRGQWIDDQLVDPPTFNHPGGQVTNGFQLTVSGPETQYVSLNGTDPRAVGGAPAVAVYSGAITITSNTLVKCRSWNGTSFIDAPSTWPWSALTEAMFVVNPATLAITEIMYHPRPPSGAGEAGFTTSDFEFIEIQNVSGAPCSLIGVRFLDGVDFDFTYGNAATLAAGSHGVVVRNLNAFKARYPDWASRNVLGSYADRLDNGGERLKLGYAPTNLLPLASFDYEADWYPATDGEGFSLVLNNPQSSSTTWDSQSAWRPSSAPDGSPGQVNPALALPQGTVVINEVLSHQDTDNPGDWIELHNTSASSINIGGWFLSDSRGNLKKFTIPAGTVIPANGYVVFTEYSHFGAAFALSEHGDAVYLSSGSGGDLSVPAYREFQDFGGQNLDVTFGRYLPSTGVADFVTMTTPTLGAANSGPRVGPVIIEEIMYHPPTNGHEYLKLVNTSGSVVPLFDPLNPTNTWKVAGIDFTFPPGVQLTAGDSLLLVRDTITPAQFRAAYGVPAAIDIFGYSGELDNDAETIALKKPGAPETGTGFVPSIVVEQVKYNDSAPWPMAADGGGQVLHRISNPAYGDDAANWQAVNSAVAPPLFPLTVHAGSGDGTYAAGSVVPIEADSASPGQVFVQWIGNVAGVADAHASATTLTMSNQGVTVTALFSSNTVFIAENVAWKYHAQGQDLGPDWRASDYNDSAWPSGPAQLGYGENDEATVVSYGGISTNRYPTTYFRRSFVMNAGTSLDTLSLGLLRDDGAMVYLNGQEVLRDNMPTGAVDYQTLAASTVGGTAESTYFPFALSPSMLVTGTNVMAVEIHQRALDSSDLSFAARLEGTLTVAPELLDGDADGLSDGWEINNFGSTENGSPGVDNDGDGVSNFDEFVAGTQPTNAVSFFRIEQVNPTGLFWTAVPGRIYSVERTSDLGQPFSQIASGLTVGSYLFNSPTNGAANYYRIRVTRKE
jgi:hypothetical protein